MHGHMNVKIVFMEVKFLPIKISSSSSSSSYAESCDLTLSSDFFLDLRIVVGNSEVELKTLAKKMGLSFFSNRSEREIIQSHFPTKRF